jgi:hypothetical protein
LISFSNAADSAKKSRTSHHSQRAPRVAELKRWAKKMTNLGKIVLLSLLLPCAAFAHGQQILALPVGQGLALLAVIVVVFVVRISGKLRAALVLLAIGMIVLTWFIPDPVSLIGGRFEDSGPWFIVGVLPPVIAVSSALAALAYKRKKPNQPPEPMPLKRHGSS